MDDRPPHGTGLVILTGYALVFWLVVGCAYFAIPALIDTYQFEECPDD